MPSIASIRFVLLCSLWYMSSALSSNTGKAIMTRFKYPVTLTFVQFGFVAGYCLLFATPVLRFTTIRPPTDAIIRSTLPMALFQVFGHIFSSMAISRIPVSTVHTIKALSPLFTVGAYALLFGVSYSSKTYLSLLPLTLGVMLACSFDVSASNMLGLLCAFGSALIFVSSNIFFKKIMPTSSSGSTQSHHKLDKLNLLFYSSGLAFLLMIPIWLYYDFGRLWVHWTQGDVAHSGSHTHGVMYYFFMNGTVHWAQNIIAFAILASTSPVTYSIASLVKRIVVIVMAIIWFRQAVHPVQGVGIAMTFFGLWMYNAAKGDVEQGESKVRRVEAAWDMALPTSLSDVASSEASKSLPNVSGFRNRSSSHGEALRPPPLHITTPNKPRIQVISPIVESYPSPPLSFDSPPPTHIHPGLDANGNLFARRPPQHQDERSSTPVTTTVDSAQQQPRQAAMPVVIAAQ
ncbi:TPT-domain-containing protein [Exidia glandulosa HHB12029]|uniref:TPT-domain-containing protein n=1 Tax=Exidia glandulosa HHB12029 TaxID=1314781 RepID=A0A165IAJ7_EXIGL|nr:TPT-domain-containing protein [Exidia glandulosa HHB12029]